MRNGIPQKVKDKVLKRSRGYCEVCRINEGSDVHHIIPVCEGGENNIDNLTYLCKFCHDHVPGDCPDGYREEFDYYKKNGGPSWGVLAMGFYAGWYASGKKLSTYRECSKYLHMAVRSLIRQKIVIPIRPSFCFDVFK